MDDNWYNVDEREREINAIKELRGSKNRNKDNRPSVAKDFTIQLSISPKQVNTLLNKHYNNPVISLYINLTPDKLIRENKVYVSFFHSLKHKVLNEQKDFIKTLTHVQKQSLETDLQEIDQYLTNEFDPSQARSLIIFKSGDDLKTEVKMPVRTSDNLVINSMPYIAPLEFTFEQYKRVLCIHITKTKAEYSSYYLGLFEDLGSIESFVPDDSVDESQSGKPQQHRLNHLHNHIRKAAQAAYTYFKDNHCDVVILLGEESTSDLLYNFLHEKLKEKVIGQIRTSPQQTKKDIKTQIENMLQNYEKEQEKKELESLGFYTNEGLLVEGLPQVLQAQNRFLIRKLFINEDLSQKGYSCSKHHYLSLQQENCPFCNQPLLSIDNIIVELIDQAYIRNVTINLIQYQKDILKRHQDIAGVTYKM